MTADQKLAQIFRSVTAAGIDVLVMGGHAVRYYGIDRNTADFDLVTSLATPEELRQRLPGIQSMAHVRAEPVWRSRDFSRFEIGRLPDGREEWLEFWIRNHLLDEFESLNTRAEVGQYGGESVRFLSIADLLRSLDPVLQESLLSCGFGSQKHFALVEICRRAYKRQAMDLDRADKQAKLKELEKPQ